MAIAALACWAITASGGIYMLLVWLIENDPGSDTTAPTRLPAPLVAGHGLLAVTGLGLWSAYLLSHSGLFAWGSVAVLIAVASLGVTMFSRWISVYRAADLVPDTTVAIPGVVATAAPPAEQNFPVLVVFGHGMLAFTTFTLVLLTALGFGGS